ncbi:hypothetical protein MTP02_27360 [Streptomyces albus]|uniref:Uncharacterized protein n=1 Tax=Streptomyces albidoflavus TaxID=1886 RepID=A0AA37BXT4_9ACTN|nr:hypothetical protein MTP02_27360 [Streptomyces albus]GHI46822.1 hypothetical protein ScoT_29960 [Streptomyces albidoflavus]
MTTDDSGASDKAGGPSHRESVPMQGRTSAPVRLSNAMLGKGVERRGSLLGGAGAP